MGVVQKEFLHDFGVQAARYLLIIHELLVAMGFVPAGVQDESLKSTYVTVPSTLKTIHCIVK